MKTLSFRQQTWLLSMGFILMWNSGFIGAEYALPYTHPLTLLFWRYWLLVPILLGYLILRGRLHWPGARPASVSMLVGVLAHGVWLVCVLYPLELGVPAGIVALVVALQPMATGALSGLVIGEHTSFLRWTGLILGFVGVMIAVLARIEASSASSLFAYAIPFGAVVAITVASLIQRRMQVLRHGDQLPKDLGLFYQSLGTALAFTLPAILLEGLDTEWNTELAGALLWLTPGVSLGAYALMWILIDRTDATRTASLFYFGPPVTMIMAWAAFGDEIRVTDLIGLAVIAVGVGITHVHPETPS